MTEAEQMRENAAKLLQARWETYCSEHGSTDYETGVQEFPCDGADWVYEWQELEEAILALPLPTSPAETPLVEWRGEVAWIGGVRVGVIEYDGEGWHWESFLGRANFSVSAAIDVHQCRLALENEAARVVAAMGLKK